MSLRHTLIFISLFFISVQVNAKGAEHRLTVYKSASCGCCKGWLTHLKNFQHNTNPADVWHIKSSNTDALGDIKVKHGIVPQYRSCHTAVSDTGFVFEGHIPAKYIQAFLSAPPENARGLAVPGMPVGSPGMENGLTFQPYTVYLLLKDGSSRPFVTVSRLEDQ